MGFNRIFAPPCFVARFAGRSVHAAGRGVCPTEGRTDGL